MNQLTKKVKNFWLSMDPNFILDSVILDSAVQHLTKQEQHIIQTGNPKDLKYIFIMHKAYHRHNDILAGYTWFEGQEIVCTEKSSILELSIYPETYRECYKVDFETIEDIDKRSMAEMSFVAITDLTAALIQFSAIHGVDID